MSRAAVFTQSLLKQKKRNKAKLIWLVFRNIVRQNPYLFFSNTFLAILTATINFNIRYNFKEAFNRRPAISLLDYKEFNLKFFWPFGKLIEANEIGFWPFFLSMAGLILLGKGIFSILHYYWMNYAFNKVEDDLKKDLFLYFVQAKYPNSAQVSSNLLTQFTILDPIARSIWFIVNRGFYVFFSLTFLLHYDFIARRSGQGFSWLVWIVLLLFTAIFTIQYFLFRKAAKLNVAMKRRQEEENRYIFERINNIEYIKANSGEDYEQIKLNNLLNRNLQSNKKVLWWSTMFKAVPTYLLISNLNLFFILLSGLVAWMIPRVKDQPVYLMINFFLIYMTVADLRGEIEKIVDSFSTFDDLSVDLSLIVESLEILNKKEKSLPESKSKPFESGDLVFERVDFAYPTRRENVILQDFSFRFEKSKSYGIAGKNGIGKSTITKTALKLYDIQAGAITIAERNIENIETKSLHQRVCHLTNRPGFFQMSIAENIFYPHSYQRDEDLAKLTYAAKKVGISEFIESLPDGFETEIKEKGGDLSEGQKQQIAAMRIFIRDYGIYIFDEILSNVQVDLKNKILANIFDRLKNKMIIVIDHHYGIFQHVDNIYQFTGNKLIKMNKKEFLLTEQKKD